MNEAQINTIAALVTASYGRVYDLTDEVEARLAYEEWCDCEGASVASQEDLAFDADEVVAVLCGDTSDSEDSQQEDEILGDYDELEDDRLWGLIGTICTP